MVWGDLHVTPLLATIPGLTPGMKNGIVATLTTTSSALTPVPNSAYTICLANQPDSLENGA
jgi:hypothetical protein